MTRIYRTDRNDEAEGHTGADDTDEDHVVIRTNGHTIEVHASEAGQPFAVNACAPACTP